MHGPDPQSDNILRHLRLGVAVGLAVFLFWGFINALLILGTTAAWFNQFVQGAPVPPAAKAYLWRSTPIFAISMASHGVMGIVLGALWGTVVGLYFRWRRRTPATAFDLLCHHAASFIAFPLFFLTALGATVAKWALGKNEHPVTLPRALLFLVLLVVSSWLLFLLARLVLRFVLRLPGVRATTSPRGFGITMGAYALVTVLISFVPPMLVGGGAAPRAGAGRIGAAGAGPEPPNVLLVVLDTTRADHLSCYGYPRKTTPFLDRLADEGTLFEYAYSPANWTLAGHASIFTGMAPSKNGANAEHLYLEASFTTLAEILARNGYRTAGFCNNPWVSEFTGMDQGFQHYRKMWLRPYGTNFLLSNLVYRGILSLFTDISPPGGVVDTTEEALAWIRDNDDSPFFVFLNFMEAHPPLDFWPEHTPPFLPDGATRQDVEAVNQNPYGIWAGVETMDEKAFAAYRALYDGELHYLDSHLEAFFDRLEADGTLDRTLVIVTADHGEQIGEGGFLGHHFSLRDALIRVPLILRYPGRFPPGSRVTAKVQTLDILPTVLDATGIDDAELLAPLQGESLYPLPEEDRTHVIAEEFRPTLEMKFVNAYEPEFDVQDVFGHRSRAYLQDGYKLVWSDSGREELFAPARDPQEVEDLAPGAPEIVKRLKARLLEWMASFEPFELEGSDYTFSPDKATEEQLRSLGYIQ